MRRALACASLLLAACVDTSALSMPDLAPPADITVVFPDDCKDGIQNDDETDVDCGGARCGKCDAGRGCLHGSDCAGVICDNNVCAAASCTDRVKNGSETDVDCGGSCPGC